MLAFALCVPAFFGCARPEANATTTGDKAPVAAEFGYTAPADASKAVAAQSTAVEYTVRPGDTLSDLAELFGTSVEQLTADNPIDDPSLIFPGQVLTVEFPAR